MKRGKGRCWNVYLFKKERKKQKGDQPIRGEKANTGDVIQVRTRRGRR